MADRLRPDPAELRMILANNLRVLCQNTVSISEVCRDIGVNRTQFNRYLSGSAFPRPDVLYRICQHFEVDANILLRPLGAQPRADPVNTMFASKRPFDHYLLPDGMYRYWRRSFRQPDLAYLGMAIIRTKSGAKVWKGYDVHDFPIRSGSGRHSRSSSYEGMLVQQFDGFTVISRTPYSDLMNVSYFEYGLGQLLDYYSGISFITRRRLPDSDRLSAIVMQRLPTDCPEWLKCGRECGTQKMRSLPVLVRAALDRIPEGL